MRTIFIGPFLASSAAFCAPFLARSTSTATPLFRPRTLFDLDLQMLLPSALRTRLLLAPALHFMPLDYGLCELSAKGQRHPTALLSDVVQS